MDTVKQNDRIVSWIQKRVETEYAHDVALVLLYGSYINGTANEKSDVDCYFIPKTERGYQMAITFMIEDVGYDVFPITWERLERIADLEDGMQPFVGDVRILYCQSTADRQRFENLQQRLNNNLKQDSFVQKAAAAKCEQAQYLAGLLQNSKSAVAIRKIAGGMLMVLAEAIALSHHDYYHFGLKKQYEDLSRRFPQIPKTVVDSYRDVSLATDVVTVRENALRMYTDTCAYLGLSPVIPEVQTEETAQNSMIDVAAVAGLYEEISSTFHKIYYCCQTQNRILAFLSAVCLQHELDEAGIWGCPSFDLLTAFDAPGLDRLYRVTEQVQRELVEWISDQGGALRQYDSFEAFEKAGL